MAPREMVEVSVSVPFGCETAVSLNQSSGELTCIFRCETTPCCGASRYRDLSTRRFTMPQETDSRPEAPDTPGAL